MKLLLSIIFYNEIDENNLNMVEISRYYLFKYTKWLAKWIGNE